MGLYHCVLLNIVHTAGSNNLHARTQESELRKEADGPLESFDRLQM